MGTYNRCWSFDLYIFYDQNEKISHLNIHHTVKTDVIPNTKATFSSSYVILSISGLLSLLNSMICLTSCLHSLLDLMSGLVFNISSLLDLTSGLSFFSVRLIFTLIPILKLGDAINILLLYLLSFQFVNSYCLGVNTNIL